MLRHIRKNLFHLVITLISKVTLCALYFYSPGAIRILQYVSSSDITYYYCYIHLTVCFPGEPPGIRKVDHSGFY